MQYNDELGRALLAMAQDRPSARSPNVSLEQWHWRAPATGWQRAFAGLLPPEAQLWSARLRCCPADPRAAAVTMWWLGLEAPANGGCAYLFARVWEDGEMQPEFTAEPGDMDREAATVWLTRRTTTDARLLAGGDCPCGGRCRAHRRAADIGVNGERQ